jgi:hypothetical protein
MPEPSPLDPGISDIVKSHHPVKASFSLDTPCTYTVEILPEENICPS